MGHEFLNINPVKRTVASVRCVRCVTSLSPKKKERLFWDAFFEAFWRFFDNLIKHRDFGTHFWVFNKNAWYFGEGNKCLEIAGC